MARAQRGIRPATMAEAATTELRSRILAGRYSSGTQLRQTALAEEQGISRIPLREALLQLEAEGLVRIEAHKGATVSKPSQGEIDELFELRAAIEPLLLELSAPRLTTQDFAEIATVLDEFTHELRTENVKRWGTLNTRFHQLLYQHANRPRIMALAFNLLQECDWHTRVQLSQVGAMERAEEEHLALLTLCRSGHYGRAALLLRKHILNVRDGLRQAPAAPG